MPRVRKPKDSEPKPELTIFLNPTGRERLRVLLDVSRAAVDHLPRKVHSVLYGTTRDLRHELYQAVIGMVDHLDREGMGF
jgi:hypothetical protein